MVVNDLNSFRSGIRPRKADAPLVINADAVLSDATTLKRFQPVSRWYRQFAQGIVDIKLFQFSVRRALHIGVQLADVPAIPDLLGEFAGEGPDRDQILPHNVSICSAEGRGSIILQALPTLPELCDSGQVH